MIHQTYRSLDAPVKLVGFTLRQWAAIIAGASLVIGLVVELGLPTKAAISLCVLAIGVPVALTYVSESGGLALSALLRDCLRWRIGRTELPASPPTRPQAAGIVVGRSFDERLRPRETGELEA